MTISSCLSVHYNYVCDLRIWIKIPQYKMSYIIVGR